MFNYVSVIEGADFRKRREVEWFGIVIHHTGVGGRKELDQTMWDKLFVNLSDWLARKDDNYVSSHFVISRDGKIVQIIDPDKYEAFHVGESSWWHPWSRKLEKDWNRYAIGVELIGDGNLHEYSTEQYASLTKLCRDLMKRYESIHPLCITSHEAMSGGRKVDPGIKFEWARFFSGIFTR